VYSGYIKAKKIMIFRVNNNVAY